MDRMHFESQFLAFEERSDLALSSHSHSQVWSIVLAKICDLFDCRVETQSMLKFVRVTSQCTRRLFADIPAISCGLEFCADDWLCPEMPFSVNE